MAKHITISQGQAIALKRFLDPRLTSVDETTQELGQEDSFRLWTLKGRLDEQYQTPKKK